MPVTTANAAFLVLGIALSDICILCVYVCIFHLIFTKIYEVGVISVKLGTEKLSNWLKLTQLGSGRTRLLA